MRPSGSTVGLRSAPPCPTDASPVIPVDRCSIDRPAYHAAGRHGAACGARIRHDAPSSARSPPTSSRAATMAPTGGDWRRPISPSNCRHSRTRSSPIKPVTPAISKRAVGQRARHHSRQRLPDEYVVIGAHYDHLGPTPATAAGARPGRHDLQRCDRQRHRRGHRLAVAHLIAESGPPRRSVLVAFWDREEDGLLGSSEFVANPIVPLDQMVAYLNFDIQGSNLLPSLRETTVMVGAETGGPALVDAAQRPPRRRHSPPSHSAWCSVRDAAITPASSAPAFRRCSSPTPTTAATTPLVTTSPSSTSPSSTNRSRLRSCSPTSSPTPTSTRFVPTTLSPLQDAVSMLAVTQAGQVDFTLLPELDRATLDQYVVDLQRMVDEGEAASTRPTSVLCYRAPPPWCRPWPAPSATATSPTADDRSRADFIPSGQCHAPPGDEMIVVSRRRPGGW